MKKFFTAVPDMGLQAVLWTSENQSIDHIEEATSFAIIPLIVSKVAPGEKYELIALMMDPSTSISDGYNALQKELETVCQIYDLYCPEIKILVIPDNELTTSHIGTYRKLIDQIGDNDVLFADISYGSKALGMALWMAMRYGYEAKNNTSVSYIVDGQISALKRREPKGMIRDLTPMFQLEEIVTLMAQNHRDPKRALDTFLAL